MNKKSIGILAYYWPPAGGSGVQRWLRFSNHLFDLGWDVHVFTFSNPNNSIITNGANALKIEEEVKTENMETNQKEMENFNQMSSVSESTSLQNKENQQSFESDEKMTLSI